MAHNITTWQPGQSGNPKGRPPMNKNKFVPEQKRFMMNFLAGRIPQDLPGIYERASDVMKIKIMEMMLKYVMPAKVELSGNEESAPLQIIVKHKNELQSGEED